MDNEAIVDQIVRSLSFEVLAVPQHVIQVDSTSKSTPLNVKIRVRKKHEADLRHGVLSMPKVDVKNDSRKNPDRVRLVSSDQTIMNFNVLLEAEFDKRRQKQNINIITPDLKENNEDNINMPKNLNLNTAPIVSKKNKDIFGKCKPGGCLDPPFGEDKYSYLPTQQNLLLPLKGDTVKLRSSSIFKNNIFKRKKKTSQSDDELNISSSKTNVNDKVPLEVSSPYSSSIITYPPPPDSDELPKFEERKINREEEQSYRTRYSSDERSKASSIDEGGYYMIPKKTKKSSIQNDINKMQRTYSKPDENNLNNINIADEMNLKNKNILHTKSSNDNLEENTKNIAHSFIPIPLPVPNGTVINSKPEKYNISTLNSNMPLVNNEHMEIIARNKENNSFMEQRNVELPKSDELNYTNPSSDTKKSTSMNKSYTKFIEPLPTNVLVNKSRHSNGSVNNDKHTNEQFLDIQESRSSQQDNIKTLSALTDEINNSTSDDIMNNRYSLTDWTDLKSHPLLADAREKSLLDVTNDSNDEQVKEKKCSKKSGDSFNLSNYVENYESDSPPDLSKIWENETDHLISNADVITSRIMQQTKEYVRQEEQRVIHKTISEIDLQADLITLSDARISKSSAENILKIDTNNTEEHLINNFNISDFRSPDGITEISQEKPLTIINDTEMRNSKTYNNDITKDNKTQNKLYENFEVIPLSNEIVEYSKSDHKNLSENEQNNNEPTKKIESSNIMEAHGSQNTIHHVDTDDKAFTKSKEVDYSENLKLNEVNGFSGVIPSVSVDDDHFTDKNVLPYSTKQSFSDRSIVGSEIYTSSKTSGEQDDKYLKLDSSGFEKTAKNLLSKEKNNLNDTIFEQKHKSEEHIPQIKTQPEKTNDTGEQILGLDQIYLENLSIDLSKRSRISQPASIIATDIVPWKIDIALQSYVDENNEKIIKSLDSTNIPEKHPYDAFLVAKCYLGNEMNEIKIPIDQDNDLSVKVVNVKPQHQTLVAFNDIVGSSDKSLVKTKIKTDVAGKSGLLFQASVCESNDMSKENEKKKIKMNVPDSNISDKDTKYEKFNKAEETNRYKKAIMSGDLRSALTSIYEEELVPLQGIIKGLREEIDSLLVNQMKLKVQNFAPNRAKSLKLINVNKKCSCLRRLENNVGKIKMPKG